MYKKFSFFKKSLTHLKTPDKTQTKRNLMLNCNSFWSTQLIVILIWCLSTFFIEFNRLWPMAEAVRSWLTTRPGLLLAHFGEELARWGEQVDQVVAQVLAEHDIEEYVDATVHVHEDLGEFVGQLVVDACARLSYADPRRGRRLDEYEVVHDNEEDGECCD